MDVIRRINIKVLKALFNINFRNLHTLFDIYTHTHTHSFYMIFVCIIYLPYIYITRYIPCSDMFNDVAIAEVKEFYVFFINNMDTIYFQGNCHLCS